jgi:hypothetical protein
MSVDVVLFLGRVLFLIGLYLFLVLVVIALRRDLSAQSVPADELAPGELVVVDPGASGLHSDAAFPLAAVTFIGRTPDNTIVVPDATVSARHGRLIHVHGDKSWFVEDLGSTNGTYVNGRRIHNKTRLNYGDIISFGGVSMKLVR